MVQPAVCGFYFHITLLGRKTPFAYVDSINLFIKKILYLTTFAKRCIKYLWQNFNVRNSSDDFININIMRFLTSRNYTRKLIYTPVTAILNFIYMHWWRASKIVWYILILVIPGNYKHSKSCGNMAISITSRKIFINIIIYL